MISSSRKNLDAKHLSPNTLIVTYLMLVLKGKNGSKFNIFKGYISIKIFNKNDFYLLNDRNANLKRSMSMNLGKNSLSLFFALLKI
ncbi:hypothetical protein BpHYR1_039512 [Brachionus plicatilis]|uniref:Uncharacterized protein n=1 Tax=Brachionus plicatilis TaxID=10195 RepID=A0A3M7R2X5_BRAPC|nr:hypothetical protein BpHYR1_039512 [Brachionus plicatilis]